MTFSELSRSYKQTVTFSVIFSQEIQLVIIKHKQKIMGTMLSLCMLRRWCRIVNELEEYLVRLRTTSVSMPLLRAPVSVTQPFTPVTVLSR